MDRYQIEEWQTVYIGGGTPSVLNAAQWERLSILWKNFRTDRSECTTEINPESLNLEKLKIYNSTGVNRLSMGIQSFNEKILKKMGRPGSLQETEQALEWIHSNWNGQLSGDLIYGYPETTIQDWLQDIREFSKRDIPHLSLYQLTFEESSILSKSMEERLKIKTTNIQDEFWPECLSLIKSLGFQRYEVSNFTKETPSFHNRRYWNLDGWIGLGPGASSFIPDINGGIHYHNKGNLTRYLSLKDFSWGNPYFEKDRAHGKDFIIETLMMGLRHTEGFPLEKIEALGVDIEPLKGEFDKIVLEGFCRMNQGRLSPTDKGLDFHNQLLLRLMKHL